MAIISKMDKSNISTVLAILASAASVAAHGHVKNLVINGVYYETYDSTSFPYQENPPIVVGWTIDQLDNGPVYPDSYSEPDIICHRQATPAQGHVEVSAGDVITLQWTGWPDSHYGPILDYLANCYGPCEDVDKTELEFFKIDGIGLIEKGEQGRPGKFADDVLVENGYTWNVKIPENIQAGNYVLRHEIIALHNAIDENGAQNYPQCFNLKITSDGEDSPNGYLGTELYDANDPGILVNVYAGSGDYEVPGPTIIEGGITSVRQEPSSAYSTGKCTTRS
ncbi:Fc.00g050370.m01.CDS01 [Cosmosporella sp. VM-42]